nr:hypothetical protein Itr_chr05CG00990 [Ipomoea trifida]
MAIFRIKPSSLFFFFFTILLVAGLIISPAIATPRFPRSQIIDTPPIARRSMIDPESSYSAPSPATNAAGALIKRFHVHRKTDRETIIK